MSMKQIMLFLLALLSGLTSQAQMKKHFVEGQRYVYELVYSHDDLLQRKGERCFFVLWQEQGTLHGRYNGTTDALEQGREGYLPGYVVAPMQAIKVLNDSTLSFTLSATTQFANELPLCITSEAQAQALGYALWRHPLFGHDSNYWQPRHGVMTLSGDRLRVQPDATNPLQVDHYLLVR